MAPKKNDEAARLRNQALLETLLYTNANLGSWIEKSDQDTTLQHIIETRNLQRKPVKGSKAREAHDVASLRGLITRAVNANQKPPPTGEMKKTTKAFFELGSNLFNDDFLDEIGFDAGEQEQIIREGMQGVRSQAYTAQLQTKVRSDIERKRKSQPPAIQVDDSEPEELGTSNGLPPLKKPRLTETVVGGPHLSAPMPQTKVAPQTQPRAIDSAAGLDTNVQLAKKPKLGSMVTANEVLGEVKHHKSRELGFGAGQKRDHRSTLGAIGSKDHAEEQEQIIRQGGEAGHQVHHPHGQRSTAGVQNAPTNDRTSETGTAAGGEMPGTKRKRSSPAIEVEDSDSDELATTTGSDGNRPGKKVKTAEGADRKDSDIEVMSDEDDGPVNRHRKRPHRTAFGADALSGTSGSAETSDIPPAKRGRLTQTATSLLPTAEEATEVLDRAQSAIVAPLTAGEATPSQQPVAQINPNGSSLHSNRQSAAIVTQTIPDVGPSVDGLITSKPLSYVQVTSNDQSKEIPPQAAKPAEAQLSTFGAPKATVHVSPYGSQHPRQILAEHSPYNLSELNKKPCDENVSNSMKKVESEVRACAVDWCVTRVRDPIATAIFLSDPTAELAQLYAILLGTKEWQLQLLKLRSREDPSIFVAMKVLAGLFGAAVQKEVFNEPTPWDTERRFNEALGDRTSFFEEMMFQRGYTWRDSLKHTAWLQAHDEDFQKTVIKPHASRLAHKTLLTMMPHLETMTIDPNPKEEISYEPEWIDTLENAFLEALILKSKLDAVADATFEFKWLAPDTPYAPREMRPISNVKESLYVIQALMPGVLVHLTWEKKTRLAYEPLVYCKYPGQNEHAGRGGGFIR
ncbi:hypothetical protein LTS10_000922 [Elasticomyces elasticus]|nr:hypothetical protein LTS10_000922 [Elasticomyces elasticus]